MHRAVHETMDIDKCDTAVRSDHCRWIGSAGLAFLDAVVRGRPAAQQWLDSDAYRVLVDGAVADQVERVVAGRGGRRPLG